MSIGNVVDRVRVPEYTGENRCQPCTVVNAIIAVVLAAIVGLVWPPAGILALVIFAAAIYLRGYLVPGTPALTAEYLPERVLAWFGKAEAVGETETAGEPAEEVDVEELLSAADVVEEDPEVDDLRLTDRFHEVWWRRIRQLREGGGAEERLAAIIDVDPDELEVGGDGDRFVVSFEGEPIGRWDSDAAFYADLAVEPTLGEWIPEWETLGDRTRTELIAGLRAFLEECPACEAELEPVEDVRKSCCSTYVSVDVDCEACGARVFSGSYR